MRMPLPFDYLHGDLDAWKWATMYYEQSIYTSRQESGMKTTSTLPPFSLSPRRRLRGAARLIFNKGDSSVQGNIKMAHPYFFILPKSPLLRSFFFSWYTRAVLNGRSLLSVKYMDFNVMNKLLSLTVRASNKWGES